VIAAPPAPVRLLVVDDDPRFADYLRVLLKRTRTTFEIDLAATVTDALRELSRGRHQVCMLDYRLGLEDGLEVLRRAQTRGLRTPIILLTGDRDDALEFTALEEGAADYLNKADLEPGRLERLVSRAIARFRADAALRDRESRLAEAEAVTLVMPAHIGLDGRWLKVPPRLCDMLGYSEDELLAMRLEDVTHPDDVTSQLEQRKRLLDGGLRSVELEERYVRKDGEIVWTYQNCSLITGESGQPLYFLGYLRDIGDQKRAEEALRASEQRYSSMVLNAPYGIFEATRDGWFITVNPALVAMLGYESEHDVVPLDPDELYGNRDERTRVFRQIVAARRSTGVEARWRRRDGSVALVSISAHAVPGKHDVITGVVADITERKGLEDKLRHAQKMEAIGQLAGGVAHDFNNLLTAILGYTELLKDRCADMPDVYADLDEVHNAGKTAASLTEQLLAFSRKQVLKPQVVDLNSVIFGMENLLTRVIGEDIALVIDLDHEVPAIEADPGQLQQVILNLAVNARDAMPHGGRVVIETSEQTIGHAGETAGRLLPGRYVVLTVLDTGCGMDAATQARIFEPFFTTKLQGKGTGLGLATVYGIIKQTGGDIVCETKPNAGTKFSVFLPASMKKVRAATTASADQTPGSGTVLLVEDQAAVRRLTRRILETNGYRVLDTGDAETALALLRDNRIDILLTDVVMPQMSGVDLARRARAFLPALPVLFMSGFSGHSALDAITDAPFIQKPFAPQALVSKIRDILHQPAVAPGERRRQPNVWTLR
jgi:PAS domain S-box-containing protein